LIRDQNRKPAELGQTGDLVIRGVRGLSLFAEYYRDPEATEAAFDDEGWFITGDRAVLLESGWMMFADRAKDMMKVGGENVAASEVERVLAELPGIREVAVVARPHPLLDEEPVAFIRMWCSAKDAPRTLAADAIELCKQRLADFKVPREI